MSKNKSMTQLLRVRHLEEEQCRLRLESMLAEEQSLDRACLRAFEHGRSLRIAINRAMLAVAVQRPGELIKQDREDALLERRAAEVENAANERAVSSLRRRLTEARALLDELRSQYIEARVKRMQVETVLGEEAARERQTAGRRHQTALDDWYGSRAAQTKPGHRDG